MGKCPICQEHEAQPSDVDGDYQRLDCPRCGQFRVAGLYLASTAPHMARDRRLRVSSALRRLSARGGAPFLKNNNEEDLVHAAAIPPDPPAQLDELLLLVKDRTKVFGENIRVDPHEFAAILGVAGPAELWSVAKEGEAEGLCVPSSGGPPIMSLIKLNPAGWKRVKELGRVATSHQCFVAMASDPMLPDACDHGVLPALNECGWLPFRPERSASLDRIDDVIVRELRRSGMVIADVTRERPNVYFEAGLAQGMGLPVIWTAQHGTALHFDTRQYPHLIWTDPAGLRTALENRIEALGLGRRRGGM